MKKTNRIALVLTIVFLVSVSVFGCNKEVTETSKREKSENAKKVEEQINNIGDVSLEDGEIILSIQKDYDGLTDEEKSDVENYDILCDAKTEYDNLVKEKVSGIDSDLGKIDEALKKNDYKAVYEALDRIDEAYGVLPKEEQDKLDLENKTSKARSSLESNCYAGTYIRKFENVVGRTGISEIDDDGGATKYTVQHYYSYSNGDTALNSFNKYVEYLNGVPGVVQESFDYTGNTGTVVYSYEQGNHLDFYIVYGGPYGGWVSVGFY